jgi:hypothetical protein
MKTRLYAFRASIALLAFSFGVVNFYQFQLVQSYFGSEKGNSVSQDAVKQEHSETSPTSVIQENLSNTEEAQLSDFTAVVEYYSDEATLQKDFGTFRSIEIEIPDYQRASIEKVDKKAIRTKGAINFKRQYRFNRTEISEKDIAFETETINGISYRFTGHFFKDKDIDPAEEYLQIHGHLTRLKNGKKMSEADIELFASDC